MTDDDTTTTDVESGRNTITVDADTYDRLMAAKPADDTWADFFERTLDAYDDARLRGFQALDIDPFATDRDDVDDTDDDPGGGKVVASR